MIPVHGQGPARHAADIDSFDRVYESCKTDVYRYALYLTGNGSEAEELYQETWFRVVKYLHKLEKVKNVKAWIMTIESNIFKDLLRKKRVRRYAVPLHELKEVSFSPDDHSRNTDMQLSLDTALTLLPPGQRQVFILKETEGYKLAEIGQILKKPVGTVKSLLHRAVKRLQVEIEQ